MWMAVCYGLKVEANNKWSSISLVSQFLCHESIHGKFAKLGAPNNTFTGYPTRAASMSAAIGLYYNGAYTTNLGNNLLIRTNAVWPGFTQYTTLPNGYAKEGKVQSVAVTGGYTAEYECRGNGNTFATFYDANRNAGTAPGNKAYSLDWDFVDPNNTMPDCGSYNSTWDLMTFAKCHVSGTSPNIIQACVVP